MVCVRCAVQGFRHSGSAPPDLATLFVGSAERLNFAKQPHTVASLTNRIGVYCNGYSVRRLSLKFLEVHNPVCSIGSQHLVLLVVLACSMPDDARIPRTC